MNTASPMLMSLEDSRRTQKPYRYGMVLLCVGALINWVALSDAEPNAEPIRYVGVSCILGGALLICTAMCCWLHAPNNNRTEQNNENDDIHVITINDDTCAEKPPNYDEIILSPPSYQEAIKLNPSILLSYPPNFAATASQGETSEIVPASTSTSPSFIVNKLKSFGSQSQLPEVHQLNEKNNTPKKSDDTLPPDPSSD